MSRRHAVRLAGFYRRLADTRQCSYCGLSADTWDHFIPVSVRSSLIDLGSFAPSQAIMIRCCVQCNSLAGSRLFRTIGQKRRYIQARIKHKYRKYLAIPHWTQYEIERLEWNLKTYLLKSLQIQAITRRRITFRTNVISAGEAFAPNGIGNDFVRPPAVTLSMPKRLKKPEPCIRLDIPAEVIDRLFGW